MAMVNNSAIAIIIIEHKRNDRMENSLSPYRSTPDFPI